VNILIKLSLDSILNQTLWGFDLPSIELKNKFLFLYIQLYSFEYNIGVGTG